MQQLKCLKVTIFNMPAAKMAGYFERVTHVLFFRPLNKTYFIPILGYTA